LSSLFRLIIKATIIALILKELFKLRIRPVWQLKAVEWATCVGRKCRECKKWPQLHLAELKTFTNGKHCVTEWAEKASPAVQTSRSRWHTIDT